MGYRAAVSKEPPNSPGNAEEHHRHLAYAAGLVLGLNNMLITKAVLWKVFYGSNKLDVIPDSPLKEELCLYKRMAAKYAWRTSVAAVSTSEYDRRQCYSLLRKCKSTRNLGSYQTIRKKAMQSMEARCAASNRPLRLWQ